MSGSDDARRVLARQDKVARGEARKARQERQAVQEAAALAVREAEQARLVAEVKAARASGVLCEERRPARRREPAKPGNGPVLGTREVSDPYGLEPGAKIMAIVNLAEHPLEMMLARRRLSQPLYEAGVRFRMIYERAAIGPGRGIDPGKIKVDGGRFGDPLSDSVVDAQFELAGLARQLGHIGERVVSQVAGQGVTVADLAARWPGPEDVRTKRDYLTMRLKEALDLLASEVWGAKGPSRGTMRGERQMGSGHVDDRAVAVANQSYLRKRGIAV